MHGLVCWTFIADLYDSSQVFEEKCVNESKVNIIEACKPNKAAKGGPKREDSKPKSRSKTSTKRVVRGAAGPGRTEATTGCPWWGARPVVGGRTAVRPTRTAVRATCARAVVIFSFLLRDFSASGGFVSVLPLYYNESGHSRIPNSLHSIAIFHFLH